MERFRATSSRCCSVKLVIVSPPPSSGRMQIAQRSSSLVTKTNYLIAHPVRKHTNVGLPVVQPQFALEPDIDLPFFHVPALLQMLQRPVSQNSLVPEVPICQSPHRPVCPAMGAYIGIAGRPAITKIDIFALGTAATAIDCAGWPKRSVSMAIRTFDLFLLRHKNHHLQMRIDDGAKASFSVKKQC